MALGSVIDRACSYRDNVYLSLLLRNDKLVTLMDDLAGFPSDALVAKIELMIA